jgi:hypothetical protein
MGARVVPNGLHSQFVFTARGLAAVADVVATAATASATSTAAGMNRFIWFSPCGR